jgi:hypothetical protein
MYVKESNRHTLHQKTKHGKLSEDLTVCIVPPNIMKKVNTDAMKVPYSLPPSITRSHGAPPLLVNVGVAVELLKYRWKRSWEEEPKNLLLDKWSAALHIWNQEEAT